MKKTLLTLIFIFNMAMSMNSLAASNEGEETLKTVLQDLYTHCGTRGKSIQSTYYTNFVQETYTVKPFSCDANNPYLVNAMKSFEQESENDCAYIYVEPSREGTYDIKLRDTTIPLRVNDELMWMISKKNSGDARLIDIYGLSFSENNDGNVNGTVYLITKQRSDLPGDEVNDGSSDADLLSDVVKDRRKKFVLEGTVSPEIADSCYNVYMTNVGDRITDNDLVARVLVKDKKFRFETELDDIEKGRIRALFPGDKLCSAWIDVYFIPGFTLEMTVRNGTCAIHNQQEYNAFVNEWLNKDRVLSYSGKGDTDGSLLSRGDVAGGSKGSSLPAELIEKLDSYQYLLDQYRNEIAYINSLQLTYNFRADETKKLLAKMGTVTEKIEALVEEYIKNPSAYTDVAASSSNTSKEERSAYLKTKIDAYQYLLNQYRNEIAYVNSLQLTYNFRADETKKLLAKMERVTTNMETLINEYVKQIK